MFQRKAFIVGLVLAFSAGCGPTTEVPPAAAPSPPDMRPAGTETEPVTGVTTSADGLEIAYTVRGQGKPALVFIHGWLCDQTFWSEQVEAFAADHTVVTLDLAGHGHSGAERSDWLLPSFGADVRAVVESLELSPVILIGHSLGGPAALEAAQLMPDRVVGVIGVDAFLNVEQRADPKQMEGFIKAYESDFVGTCQQFIQAINLEQTDAALIERQVSTMCSARPEAGIAQLREFGAYDQSLAMARTLAPVRSINASTSPTNVEGNRKFAPTFEASLMDDVGHFLMLERPGEFNELLAKWIADLENRLVSI